MQADALYLRSYMILIANDDQDQAIMSIWVWNLINSMQISKF